ERFRFLNDQSRGDMAVAIDIKAHVDAAELRRIEADLEAVATGLGAGCDFDGDTVERHRRRHQSVGVVRALSGVRGRCGRLNSGVASGLEMSKMRTVGGGLGRLDGVVSRARDLRSLGGVLRMWPG